MWDFFKYKFYICYEPLSKNVTSHYHYRTPKKRRTESSILNGHDLKEFAKMAMNIILENKIGTAKNFRMFQVETIRSI